MLGIALGLVIGTPIALRIARRRDALSAGWAAMLVSSPPFLALGWATFQRGRGDGIAPDATSWASHVMWALAVAGVITTGAVLWRNGDQPRAAGLVVLTVLSALALVFVLFVGQMMISNTWL